MHPLHFHCDRAGVVSAYYGLADQCADARKANVKTKLQKGETV